jgi:transposase
MRGRAPSLIPRHAGDRVKTDRRDAASLARLHRAGELTAVWVPDPGHEAMRDLVRARLDAVHALRRARHQLSGFRLRQGCHYGRPAWTRLHRRWLAGLKFEQAVHHLVLEDYVQAVEAAEARRNRLTAQIEAMLPDWTLAPVVAALQTMRGMALVNAATLIAELGDPSRFTDPTQVPRPRQLRDASTVMRFRSAHQSVINRCHDDRTSCLARQSLEQMLEKSHEFTCPPTWSGGHESG